MEKEKKSGGMMSVIAALGANILVAISKFVGFAVSGSAAMLNESIHSIVDCGIRYYYWWATDNQLLKQRSSIHLDRHVLSISIAWLLQ